MGRRRMHAAFILDKTLGYPELRLQMQNYANKVAVGGGQAQIHGAYACCLRAICVILHDICTMG